MCVRRIEAGRRPDFALSLCKARSSASAQLLFLVEIVIGNPLLKRRATLFPLNTVETCLVTDVRVLRDQRSTLKLFTFYPVTRFILFVIGLCNP